MTQIFFCRYESCGNSHEIYDIDENDDGVDETLIVFDHEDPYKKL